MEDASERSAKFKSLDVCFVLDCTQSMQPVIDSVKGQIMAINEQIESPAAVCCE